MIAGIYFASALARLRDKTLIRIANLFPGGAIRQHARRRRATNGVNRGMNVVCNGPVGD